MARKYLTEVEMLKEEMGAWSGAGGLHSKSPGKKAPPYLSPLSGDSVMLGDLTQNNGVGQGKGSSTSSPAPIQSVSPYLIHQAQHLC